MGNIKTGIKMRVNPEQSRKVQEICFEKGIGWTGANKSVQFINKPYLFINEKYWRDDYIAYMHEDEEEAFLKEENEEVSAELFIRTNGTCVESEALIEDNNKKEQREELKLECLVKGYEGTYFEIGQVWETREGNKIILKGFMDDRQYPLVFDIGNSEINIYTLEGTFFYGEVGHKGDFVKLISTGTPTEVTPSKESQPKTLSEYLKENNAYKAFIENCVEEFLNDINWYSKIKIKPKEDSIISLGNTFHWYTTKEGFYYWLDLSCNKPKNFVDDMDEIVFAEVDKRIAEQKTPTKYMVFVEGRSTPKKVHNSYDLAEKEAKRLSAKEVGCNVMVLSVVKTFKSKVIVEAVM